MYVLLFNLAGKQRLAFAGQAFRAQLKQLPALTVMGLLGLGLGALCAGVALVHRSEVPPEGDLLDTATFDAALGIFILTLAALAPGVEWGGRTRQVWARFLVAFTLYAYAIETIQAFRGLDPRFSRVASPLDQAAGGIFFLVALAIMVCFSVLAVKYFRAPTHSLAVAVRYGAAASFIAFGVGIWMSIVTRGRVVPNAGNLLVPHAVGFHGLQVLPLLALFLRWGNTSESTARRRVHAAGLVWLAACLALAWQAASGRASFNF